MQLKPAGCCRQASGQPVVLAMGVTVGSPEQVTAAATAAAAAVAATRVSSNVGAFETFAAYSQRSCKHSIRAVLSSGNHPPVLGSCGCIAHFGCRSLPQPTMCHQRCMLLPGSLRNPRCTARGRLRYMACQHSLQATARWALPLVEQHRPLQQQTAT
jgi:hypothetical protein